MTSLLQRLLYLLEDSFSTMTPKYKEAMKIGNFDERLTKLLESTASRILDRLGVITEVTIDEEYKDLVLQDIIGILTRGSIPKQ